MHGLYDTACTNLLQQYFLLSCGQDQLLLQTRLETHFEIFERTMGVLKEALQPQSDPRAEGF